MKNTKLWLLSTAVLLIAAGSFLRPPALFALQDRGIAKEASEVPMDEVDLSLISELAMVDKLALAADAAATTIELENGFGRDSDGVRDDLLEAFAYAGIDAGELGFYRLITRPYLVMDGDNRSIVLWTIQMQGDLLRLTAKVDDETGKILAFELTIREDDPEYDSYSKSETESDKNAVHPRPTIGEEIFYRVASMYIIEYLELGWITMTMDGADTMLAHIPAGDGLYPLPITLVSGSPSYIRVNM